MVRRAARPLGQCAKEVRMFAQVTVTQVAAPLALVSALFALMLLRYGIPRAARNGATRNGQETVGVSVVLCVGNAALMVAFLMIAVNCVTRRIDPPLFTRLFPRDLPTTRPIPISQPLGYSVDEVPDPNLNPVWWMQLALVGALICYTLSIAVLLIEMSAGRSRGQRRSAASK
jgi:hypothetical protein